MIKLYNQDCMEALKEMKNNQFDLAIVDPPYGIGDFTKEGRKNKRYKNEWSIKWNDSIPTEKYFKELKRVSKNHVVFGFQYYIEYLWKELNNIFIHDFGSVGGWGSDADLAITNLINKDKCRVAMLKYRWQGFIRQNTNETDKNRIHPCEKPVSLYEYLLINYAKKGYKILDTHLGSGSIAIACNNLGYDLEGYELNKEYFEAAKKRLNQHKNQLRIYN